MATPRHTGGVGAFIGSQLAPIHGYSYMQVIVLGFMSGGVLRGLLVGALVLVVSLFFTHLVVYNALVLLSAITLTSVLFGCIALFVGVILWLFRQGIGMRV